MAYVMTSCDGRIVMLSMLLLVPLRNPHWGTLVLRPEPYTISSLGARVVCLAFSASVSLS